MSAALAFNAHEAEARDAKVKALVAVLDAQIVAQRMNPLEPDVAGAAVRTLANTPDVQWVALARSAGVGRCPVNGNGRFVAIGREIWTDEPAEIRFRVATVVANDDDPNDPEVLADAKRFAAAPELQAACVELIRGDGTAESIQRAIDLARVGLAKVEGRDNV